MKRIAVFQTDLKIGGIQNSLISLLDELSHKEVQIDLFLGEMIEPHSGWNNISIRKMRRYSSLFKFIPFSFAHAMNKRRFDKEKYDLVIDYNGYAFDTAHGSLSCNAEKHVIWVHSDYDTRIKYNKKFRILWRMMKGKYARFDQAVVVSPGAEKSFKRLLGDKIPTRILPNLVDAEKILRMKEEQVKMNLDASKYHLVTMGRMVHSKGFDLLLELFSSVLKHRKDMVLHLIGDGEEKDKLEAQAERLGLADSVVFWGNQKNPYAIMDRMDGFAFTPRYEGQGLVLLEAKILGLEIFTTRQMEKFNVMISGVDDLEKALIEAAKKTKEYQQLKEYNSEVRKEIQELML
ncbi:glycosyltransferase [Proteiniclasticum sp. C24MP]|uniref:glycosyltransferase n=1 Tax=Proteiniclasticum sp. C24MP TaxID=3374101 RepID=UPI003754B0CE